MKKLIYGAFFLAIVGIVFASCKKEEVKIDASKNNFTSEINESAETRDVVVGFYFTWDEWGRKSYGCKKGGLCKFRLETIKVGFGYSAPVITDVNNQMSVQVLADLALDNQDSNKDFFVDEDLFANFDNEIYKVPAGVYPIDNALGTMGGYVLPLIKL